MLRKWQNSKLRTLHYFHFNGFNNLIAASKSNYSLEDLKYQRLSSKLQKQNVKFLIKAYCHVYYIQFEPEKLKRNMQKSQNK